MIVSDTAVNKSITVMVLAVIIIVLGVYCYNVLPRESDPDITIPNVFVTTSYRGVSPADMETTVTIEIEKKLKGLDGVKKIQSVSSEGLSSINVEFVTGTDIDNALQDVKDKVDEAKIPGPVARAEAEMLLEQFPLPPGYTIRFTGENEFQKESEDFLSKAFVVACFLIFLILVSQFNSVSQPFIIMTSVILSLGGAFLGLALFKQPFGIIMTGVGVISLTGVVVNNAIVLIDYINKLRERGLAVKEAVISAGATRLRPVVLTAITTILGLIPMVTGVSFDFRHLTISWVSESSQWWRSMAIVVIFGLIVATFLTLIVVPTLYSLFSSMGEKVGMQHSGCMIFTGNPTDGWQAKNSCGNDK